MFPRSNASVTVNLRISSQVAHQNQLVTQFNLVINVLQTLLGEFHMMKQSFSADITKVNLVTRKLVVESFHILVDVVGQFVVNHKLPANLSKIQHSFQNI